MIRLIDRFAVRGEKRDDCTAKWRPRNPWQNYVALPFCERYPMREPTFFEQNKAKWNRYEEQLASPRELDPMELAELYEVLLADLAHVRTFYPQSDLVHALNALCARTHWAIYRHQSKTKVGWWAFWAKDLPLVLYRLRRFLLYSGLIFALSMAIGWVAAVEDMGFVRLVLGNDYVDMTLENIEMGDPMGVYKGGSSLIMFLEIALNNLWVAFLVFALGVLGGVGTIIGLPFWPFNLQTGLFFNGIMVGAFMGMFHSLGLSMEALPVIYIHGTLELSAIVIAGAAGMALGAGILIPGPHRRWHVVRKAAIDGFKIMLGLVPVFLLAAAFEGYVTRLTDMPAALKGLIIGGSLLFVIGYYVIYPWLMARMHAEDLG